MRMDVVPGFRKTALAQWAQFHLAPGTAVVSDGLNCFPGVTAADCTHVPLVTGGGPASAKAVPTFEVFHRPDLFSRHESDDTRRV